MLDKIDKLPIEVIRDFLNHRDCKKAGIPKALGNYIIEINSAHNLYSKYRSITRCAQKLYLDFPHLSVPTCKKRIYDAINFFNSDCSVTSVAWNNYYADRFEDLADACLLLHDFNLADRLWTKAKKYRLEASSNVIAPDRIRFRHQIVSADMELKRMMGDTSPKGLLGAWEEIQSIVSTLPNASQSERDRLLDETARELNIEEIDYEDTDED